MRTYLLLRHLHRFNTHLLSQLMSPEPRRNFIFSERGNKSLSEPLLGILMHSRAYRLVSMLGLTSVSPLSCVIFQLLDFLFQPANLICHLAHPRVGVIPTKPARAVILSPTMPRIPSVPNRFFNKLHLFLGALPLYFALR